jgi:hypothetical protein
MRAGYVTRRSCARGVELAQKELWKNREFFIVFGAARGFGAREASNRRTIDPLEKARYVMRDGCRLVVWCDATKTEENPRDGAAPAVACCATPRGVAQGAEATGAAPGILPMRPNVSCQAHTSNAQNEPNSRKSLAALGRADGCGTRSRRSRAEDASERVMSGAHTRIVQNEPIWRKSLAGFGPAGGCEQGSRTMGRRRGAGQ